MTFQSVELDGRNYRVKITRKVICTDTEAIRIIIPMFILNNVGQGLIRVCLKALRKFTKEPHEIWVVDNNSDMKYVHWYETMPDINLVSNRTEPINPFYIRPTWRQKLFGYGRGTQMRDGSYSNAIGLELGRLLIPEGTKYLMTMHSDAFPVKTGWLTHMKSKLNGEVKVVSAVHDNIRINAHHIMGMLVDYQAMRKVEATFRPNMRQERYPAKPEYDVGDEVSLLFRERGWKGYTSPNTHNNSTLIECIDPASPYRNLDSVDRCFDDSGEIYYVHMGRGATKTAKTFHIKDPQKTTAEQWIEFADNHILS